MSSSSVLTLGKANAMLHASLNVVICQYVHQVTACGPPNVPLLESYSLPLYQVIKDDCSMDVQFGSSQLC